MNKYLMAVYHYFRGYQHFEIDADNKQEAIAKGHIYVCQSPLYSGGNYDTNDIKCVKKIQKERIAR